MRLFSFGVSRLWLTRMRLTRVEWALALALPATVFAFAMGSSSVAFATHIGLTLRWVMLFVLAGVAFAFGWSGRNRVSRPLLAVVGSLGAVGLLSSTWSVDPRITAERAISFLVVTTIACFVGAGASGSRHRMDLVLNGLLIGAVLVALAGLVVYVFDHSLAVQAAAVNMPARLRGFGENPNTAALLFGLVLPISILRLTTARSLQGRIVAVATTALLYGSVLASGSRGGDARVRCGNTRIRGHSCRSRADPRAGDGCACRVLLCVFLGRRNPPLRLTRDRREDRGGSVRHDHDQDQDHDHDQDQEDQDQDQDHEGSQDDNTAATTTPTPPDKTSSFTAALAPTVPKASVSVTLRTGD